MVELVETDSADGQSSTDLLRVLAAFGAGLALSAGPFLALWGTGVFECAVPLIAVTGIVAPDEEVDARRFNQQRRRLRPDVG